jgi:WD40 repeat protein
MIRKIFQWVGSLLLGGFFLILLLSLISYLKPEEKWGEALSLPTSSPTPSPWENVTLEQIRFGEPKVVLTHTLGFQIVRWISNSEVLILRDTIPGGRGNAIEVFNIETRGVKRLAEGRIWGKPVWSQQAKAIAYLLYDESRKVTSLVWQELDGQPITLLEGAVQPIVLSPGGKGAMACSEATKDLIGKVLPLPGRDIRISFALYAPPAPPALGCGWKYDTAVSPDGKWQVVYNCEHFLLMDTKGGVIKELDLGTERPGGKGLPRWAMDAQWSPDGKKLAIIATRGNLPNPIRFLLLMDPQIGTLQEVSLSEPFGIYTVQWSPDGRFLLVSGFIDLNKEGFPIIEHRLIELSTGKERKLNLFPSNPLLGRSFAWSPDGKKLILNCTEPGLAALCVLPVEVQR